MTAISTSPAGTDCACAATWPALSPHRVRAADDADTSKPGAITSVVFGGLVANDTRNEQVSQDVHAALARGRNCLVLTRQTAHVEALGQRLRVLGH
jgi:hypothetical protein